MRKATGELRQNGVAYSYTRCSTPEQDQRQSIQNQLNRAKEYAMEHRLKLADTSYSDPGISAFRGRNREEGWQLHALIKAIEGGVIRPGSTLIIENLDRLSRDFVLESLPLFMKILKAGIFIVTLSDKRVWSIDTVKKDDMQLLYSIMVLSRGHEESERKSDMIGRAWKRAQENAATRKIGQSYPGWLELRDNKFRVIPGKAAAIRSLFRQYLARKGTNAIARDLNSRGIPTFRGNKWGQTTVKFYLRFPAVIGEYHAGRRENGKKVKTGQVVQNYYPPIISREDFYRAQARLKLNPPKKGRPQKPEANLFPGLVKCGYCGGSMGIYNAKASRSYICWKSLQGGCIRVAHPADDVEITVLGTIDQVLRDAQAAKADRRKIEAIEGRIAEADGKIAKLVQIAEAGADVAEVVSRLQELRRSRDELTAELHQEKKLIEAADSPRLLQDWIMDTDMGKDVGRRLAVIPHARRHIKRIRLFPAGDRDMFAAYRDRLQAYAEKGIGGGQCYHRIRKELKTDLRRYIMLELNHPVRLDGKLTDTMTLDRFPGLVKAAPGGGFKTVDLLKESARINKERKHNPFGVTSSKGHPKARVPKP